MYSIAQSFHDASEANGRQILVRARFNGTTTLTGDNIIDASVTEAVGASGGITMGATLASKLTMKIKAPESPLALSGGTVAPSVAFMTDEETPYCPLGKFFITEAKSNDDFATTYTITGYDAFCKTETPYKPKIAMPNTAQAILADIAAQCGFPISQDIMYPSGSFDLYAYTCRQYIGYFAGLTGRNARFDRNGELTFIWYTDKGYTVDREHQYLGGFRRTTDADFSVNSITSGSSDATVTAGNGIGISFENPFMTQDVLDGIFAAVGTFSFTPAQLKWRGNPAVEAGDIIVAVDKNGISRSVYVMEQTIRVSGGLHSEIKCYGSSEADIAFDTSPQARRLQTIYTKLQDAIAEATKLLQGSNGGIFEVLDSNGDGVNDGWIIKTADERRHIKANVNGIGLTTDGGATYRTAITADGINADAITAGQLNAQRITVGDASLGDVIDVYMENGHPVVIIGASGSDIKQKQTNEALAFVNGAGDEVAKFSATGAEWSDMQQLKYCGFVWTKSKKTGNVRFTKAGDSE